MRRTASAGLAAAAVAVACTAPAAAEVQPLTLYQRVGRSPWIILGEVSDGDDRFAEVKVVEVLKGAYARPTFRIVHKLESFLRKSWEEQIDFRTGEKAVFFLKRYESDREDGKLDEDLKAEDLFAPSFGAQGKFVLPEEGSSAYLEAIRDFVRASSVADPAAQEEALLAFLGSPNPHVLQAGLEQVLERRLAGEAQVPVLLALTDHARDPIRLNALQALGQVAADLRAAKRVLPDQADVVNLLKGKVVGGAGDLYRAEALKVVAALAGAGERPFIERISREDRSQLVRYEAGRLLMDLRGP